MNENEYIYHDYLICIEYLLENPQLLWNNIEWVINYMETILEYTRNQIKLETLEEKTQKLHEHFYTKIYAEKLTEHEEQLITEYLQIIGRDEIC